MTISPYPPMPLIIGSTTLRAAPTATAASNALPPSSSTSTPARVASGCAALTIPFVPTAARAAVLVVAGPSLNSGSASLCLASDPCPPEDRADVASSAGREVDSSTAAPPVASAVRAGTPFPPEEPSEGSLCGPQEQRTRTRRTSSLFIPYPPSPPDLEPEA